MPGRLVAGADLCICMRCKAELKRNNLILQYSYGEHSRFGRAALKVCRSVSSHASRITIHDINKTQGMSA